MDSILAIDPGFHLGWVKVLYDPVKQICLLQGAGTVIGDDEVKQFILESTADIYVVEDYLIRPNSMRAKDNRRHFEHTWDKGTTIRIIGQIEGRAAAQNSSYILQQPAIKPAGYGFLGKTYIKNRKDPLVHQDDATAHLVYYLVRKRKAPPDILTRRG